MTREIDVRVAREVMGFVDHDNDGAFPTMKTPDNKIVVPPSYSTDMNAAMEVVEKMREDGWCWFKVFAMPKAVWTASFSRSHDGKITANAATPAIAICLAALETMKGEML